MISPTSRRAALLARLPQRSEALPVFATLVFCVYSWTLYRFFYQLPSWLNYLNLGGVAIIAAYVLSFALFESAVMMVFVLALNFVFPLRIFRQRFVTQGSMVALALSAAAVLLQRKIGILYDLQLWQLVAAPFIVLAVLVMLILLAPLVYDRLTFKGSKILPRLLNEIAERMVVFTYIYVPLGLIGWVIVIIRNVW